MTRGARWLDATPGTGNLRVHGTTGEVPNDAYLAERDYLIRLPRERFPVFEDSDRYVDNDATLSIHQRKYTIPAFLANRTVRVRLYAHFFEVLDPDGRIAFSRTYVGPEEKRRLVIDRTHYAGLPRRPRDAGHRQRLDESFVLRFPDLAPLVDGLKLRMKTLAHIHIRQLLRLADDYGQEAFLVAARRAQEFRRFDAGAVTRILEEEHPDRTTDPVVPLTGHGAVVLGEVDSGSLDGFGHLDGVPPTDAPPAQDTDQTKAADPEGVTPDATPTPDRDPEGEDPHGS